MNKIDSVFENKKKKKKKEEKNLPQEQNTNLEKSNIGLQIIISHCCQKIFNKTTTTKKNTGNELSEDDEYIIYTYYLFFFLHNSDKIRLQIKYIFFPFFYNHHYICEKESVCVCVSCIINQRIQKQHQSFEIFFISYKSKNKSSQKIRELHLVEKKKYI